MLVKDIYGNGSNYSSLGLPADLIASSFGKAIHDNEDGDEEEESFNDEDVAR